jgi:thioredoxin 1
MKKIFLTCALFLSAACFAKVELLSEEGFSSTTSKGFVAVDFYTDWCGPCKQFAPVYETVSGNFDGKVVFAKFNGTKKNGIFDRYHVNSIPTLILFKDGKEVKRNVGPMSKERLTQWIQEAIQK